jgi:hypothetical protein
MPHPKTSRDDFYRVASKSVSANLHRVTMFAPASGSENSQVKLHLQARRPISHWARMVSAVVGAAVVITMGALTVAVGGNEAQAQPDNSGGSPFLPASTQGPAPAAPQVPSAVPKHVQSWKCWDIFTSQC